MGLDQKFSRIKDFMNQRYMNNLAGVLVLGSANTGNYDENLSDINTMIFLKEEDGLDFKAEEKTLMDGLKDVRLQTQYVHSLGNIKSYLADKHSFATYIVITAYDGSKILHSTIEFEETKNFLRHHPFSKEEIKGNLKDKRKFELEGYFKNSDEDDQKKYGNRVYRLTQNLLFNVRRSVQVLNYFKNGELVFNLERCLNNSDLSEEDKKEVSNLNQLYLNRDPLTPNQEIKYFQLANNLVDRALG